jgi:hypothetical protein
MFQSGYRYSIAIAERPNRWVERAGAWPIPTIYRCVRTPSAAAGFEPADPARALGSEPVGRTHAAVVRDRS